LLVISTYLDGAVHHTVIPSPDAPKRGTGGLLIRQDGRCGCQLAIVGPEQVADGLLVINWARVFWNQTQETTFNVKYLCASVSFSC
jgi:hypothetical protein